MTKQIIFDIDGTLIDTEKTGVLSLIKTVKQMGFHTGIVTSRTQLEFNNEKNLKDITPLMEHIILAEDSLKHKPDPEPMLAYLKKSGASPQQCTYIGDTIHDYNCAHSAGVNFILADWYNRAVKNLTSACHIKQ